VITTGRHIWLLDTELGTTFTEEQIAGELGKPPTMGWHADRSLILGVFAFADFLAPRQDNTFRLKIQSSSDYGPAQLAAISRQAVPIFTSHGEGRLWTFRGFFRFRQPASQSVACDRIPGNPPELTEFRDLGAKPPYSN
jgi:hypothetical protein